MNTIQRTVQFEILPNAPQIIQHAIGAIWLGMYSIILLRSDTNDYNILEWEIIFTLGLNTAKNTVCIKKCFKQKLFRIKFSKWNSSDTYLYLPQEL